MPEKEEAVFRSAEMSLVQLYVPTELSREIIYEIGQLNLIQFRDLNSKVNDFQRAFVKELRKLENIERQFTFFKKELDKFNIPVKTYPYEIGTIAQQSEIDEQIDNAQLLEDRLVQLVDSNELLYKKEQDLKSRKYTISGVLSFFAANGGGNIVSGSINDAESQGLVLSHNQFVAGIISRSKVNVLQQILWRVLRGNLYYHTEEITEKIYDPKSNEFVDKNFFIIFSHGSLIYERIKKVCDSLDALLYDVDLNESLRKEALTETETKLTDLGNVVEQTQFALKTDLYAISQDLAKWWEIIAREKAVYQTMNCCDYDGSRKTLVAEGWVPTDEISSLAATIKNTSGPVPTIINVLETLRTPPTFHRTNKFTDAFQNICDAYGVATYREVNPGLPTIITFPFMFAIMFGDLGHGFILALAAGALVYFEKPIGAMKRDEIFDMAYLGRYILLLMGCFSMYTGFLYNDLFSKSMTLWESGWAWPEKFEIGDNLEATKIGVYPIGLDPAWHGTENALLFTNSYKMKLSILMGYLHMTYSYFFSLVNHINFSSMIDIIGNFVPGFLFMQGIFGYLSLCIVYKWLIDWSTSSRLPPGLLNMLISMFLSPGNVEEELYSNQASVQVFLLLIALICVPWLLLLKPLYFKRKFDKEAEYQQLSQSDADDATTNHQGDGGLGDEEEHEEHTFGDIMIHQVIHTIEFCLNCVSHTASYLRLWALSLAHAQLSTVLWTMTIGNSFGPTGLVGTFMVFFLFAMWFVLTVVILVLMEGTSAMLHSLRLHWVESMSKFFVGEGYAYEPFGFKGLLDNVL